ncbi:uncharacterized protein LOC110860811 isoform X2 [Folsomia candida]|uniref:uncharacterized protein LOC110860811 isoform X2 n=1 Tax=Folsomia candida TaxID=158441 RepID=UPI000B909B05|nr:uncharacterized protein LOC110860811 isoform X2 [Folsomia candida]
MIQNLRGAVLRVVAYESEGITGHVDSETMTMMGNQAAEKTLRDLQYILNFRIILRRWAENETNVMQAGYFESGIARELSNDRADIGVGYFFVTLSRLNISSPLIPMISETVHAYFVPLSSENLHPNVFFTTFGIDLLVVFFSVMFLISLFSVISLKYKNLSRKSIDYFDTIVIVSSLVGQQGYFMKKFELSPAYKFLVFSGELISALMFSAYTANLLLAMTTKISLIKSLDDLIDYKFDFHGKPGIYDMIHDVEKPIPFLLGETTEESVSSIFEGRSAYIGVPPTSVNGKHLLWELQKHFNSTYVDGKICESLESVCLQNANVFVASSFYTKKNSHLRDHLNQGILKIHETGLMKRSINTK